MEIQASVDEQVEEATSASGAAGSTTDSGPRQHSDITPPCHASAARKEDVYLLSDLISPENLKAISVTPIFKLGSMDAVKENFANLKYGFSMLLSWSTLIRSHIANSITAFVDQRMASAIKAKDTKNTKMVYSFISLLISLQLIALFGAAPLLGLFNETLSNERP